jgi:hypothetical protein
MNSKEINEMFDKQESDTNGKLDFLRFCVLEQQKQLEQMRKEIQELKDGYPR